MKRADDLAVAIYRALRRPFAGCGLMRFGIARAMRTVLQSILGRKSVMVKGHRMFLDQGDTLGFLGNDDYERLATKVVIDAVHEGATVVDVGAHIGYYTLLFARLLGPRGKVVAFEPDPTLFALLRRNVLLNGYRNVTMRQEAVSNVQGQLAFEVGGRAWGHHLRMIGCTTPEESRTIEVSAVRLDDVLVNREAVDFLKIDVEGVELFALEGMNDLIGRSRICRSSRSFGPPDSNAREQTQLTISMH